MCPRCRDTGKMFPLQFTRGAKPHPMSIPWYVAELAYSVYASEYGASQSLEKMAARGGFSAGEMDMFLPDWRARVEEITRLTEENNKLRVACGDEILLALLRFIAESECRCDASVGMCPCERCAAEIGLARINKAMGG